MASGACVSPWRVPALSLQLLLLLFAGGDAHPAPGKLLAADCPGDEAACARQHLQTDEDDEAPETFGVSLLQHSRARHHNGGERSFGPPAGERAQADRVRAQAQVVAEASIGLREARQDANESDELIRKLDVDLQDAEREAKQARSEAKNLTDALEEAKEQRDRTEKAAAKMREMLEELEPRNQANKDAYSQLKKQEPLVADYVNKTKEALEMFRRRIDETRPQSGLKREEVRRRADELQKEIRTLNDLNGDLQDIQKKKATKAA
eukprot:TRINITY_DN74011_c0_g1_i1.p1 TRINITY_DN74011_c0_g1~~TRINITY_DN74011_c0_g1_i1.p1  ORF type:complete len:292 (-),score=68.89 TRINITY_DN74011_c0_g1_i1:29-823(-)